MKARSSKVFVITSLLIAAVVVSYAAPQALKIDSITFSAPAPVKAGDVITVDLAGTPGVKAAFAVKNLLPPTQMKELSPGSYHGTAKVPSGKIVRNAPLVGYLGVANSHAAPVQASRLITVVESAEQPPRPAPPPAPKPKPVPKVDPEPAKLPAVKPEPRTKPVETATPPSPKPEPVVRPTPPAPPVAAPPAEPSKIRITVPADGATIKHVILVEGAADPGSTVKVAVTYSNGLSGVLKLSGQVASQDLAVGKNGKFRLGPIALDGPLATNELKFTIKAYYPNRVEHGTAEVTVTGNKKI